MNANAIVLVRHGQASFGADDYDRLSTLGTEQARLLGQWWARLGAAPGTVMRGSLRRHRETATACLEALQGQGNARADVAAPSTPQVIEDAGFDEFDHHEVLARHVPELAAPGALARHLAAQDDPRRAFQRLFAAAVARWAEGAHDADYREPWPAFKARCLAALARAQGACRAGGPVVVFTSGGPIGVMVQHLMGIPDARAFDLHWVLLNAGITRIDCRGERLALHSLNGVPHLELAGDPGLITYR